MKININQIIMNTYNFLLNSKPEKFDIDFKLIWKYAVCLNSRSNSCHVIGSRPMADVDGLPHLE